MTKPVGENIVDDEGSHELTVPALAVTTPAGLRELQKVNVDSIKARAAGELVPIRSQLGDGLIGQLATKIGDALRGVFDPAGWFAKIGQQAKLWTDGQTALNSQTGLLSPLLDYGTAFMNVRGGFLSFGDNHGLMNFKNQLGPMRGCRLHDGGILLEDKGLWDIRAQLTFENTALNVGSGRVDWRVVVFYPDGRVFSQQAGIVWNQHTVTSTVVSSVVVPAAGFVVKVLIDWIHGSRRLPGGPKFNRLTVQHISRSVGVGATGAEDSVQLVAEQDESTP